MRYLRLMAMALAGFSLSAIPAAQARPVSYPGGWTVMTNNDGGSNAVHLHYTPAPYYAVGIGAEYWPDKDVTLQTFQLNTLVKRWNAEDSQGNLYIKSGIGTAINTDGPDQGDTGIGAFTGVAADWEDRRYFVSYENRMTKAGDHEDFYMQSARVGITPYIGEYGDLHTWLMLQVDHKPEDTEHFTVTPLVRLFKGDHLVEAGFSNQGEILFNWTIRY